MDVVSNGRSGPRRLSIALHIVVALLLGSCGGGDDRESKPPVKGKPPLLGEASPVSCPGVNVAALTVPKFYVRPDGSTADGCGASASAEGACASIQQGIAACKSSACAVLVKTGQYSPASTLVMAAGASVYGSCAFDAATGIALAYRSTVIGPPDQPAINADGITNATVISGLVVLGGDATKPGGPSVAMAVSNSSSALTLQRMELIAGRGADGAKTAPPAAAAGGNPGASGNAGGAGGLACGGAVVDQGGGGSGAIRSLSLSNCKLAGCTCTDTGPRTAANGSPSLGAAGGSAGGPGPDGCLCEGNRGAAGTGGPGNPGNAGTCGSAGGTATGGLGQVSGTSWVGLQGGAGSPGVLGGGGGGGGGGGFGADVFGPTGYTGAAGGGGGGGGCGGAGGGGGQQGGASLGLVLSSAPITRATSLLVAPGLAGNGGDGGNGAPGGSGGLAGLGTIAGKVALCVSSPVPGDGGSGGNGGDGGSGAGGAGGSGGPAVGIVVQGPNSGTVSDDGVYTGQSGSGGIHGNGASVNAGCTGSNGQDGVAGTSTAVVINQFYPSQLSPGQTMQQNDEVRSPNGAYRLVMQNDTNFVLYKTAGGFLWNSGHLGAGPASAIMQTDGNLVVYDAHHGVLFATNTFNHPGAFMQLRDDGKIVVVDPSGTVLFLAP